MLEPELFEQLAAHPERNAPDVNLALAEQGPGSVLLQLARSAFTHAEALAVIGERLAREGTALATPGIDIDLAWGSGAPRDIEEDAGDKLLAELERRLIAHPHAPAALRDAVLARHRDEAFFVLAAASHHAATAAALERAAAWPGRTPLHDRLWIPLCPGEALAPLTAAEWAEDADPLRREVVARLSRDGALLARLAHDGSRLVRRGLASNVHAAELRGRLAQADAALEVRARAAGPLGEHAAAVSVESGRFAAALRALESGGVLAPDVVGALTAANAALDPEGAMLAAQALPRRAVVELVRQAAAREPSASSVGLAAGLALRTVDAEHDGEAGLRELCVEAAKALSTASEQYGMLTGKARLAAWVAEGLSAAPFAPERLLSLLCEDPLAAESAVLARGVATRPALLAELCAAAEDAERVPTALLEVAWHAQAIDGERVAALAARIVPAKRRGHDLPDDEVDLDPSARSLALLERVALAAGKRCSLAARSALAVVALDSRRVRYVLTALPQWRGRLSGAMLTRVLRQHAGAISAGKSEQRSRGAEVKGWTERPLNDAELAVALGIGHVTVGAALARISGGRHPVADPLALASALDARGALEGREAVAPMLAWAAQGRSRDGVALALWLLLERFDRERVPAMIASALDGLASDQKAMPAGVPEALALLERRRPGRLEGVFPQSPRGKATLASALARAYRATGGLREEGMREP